MKYFRSRAHGSHFRINFARIINLPTINIWTNLLQLTNCFIENMVETKVMTINKEILLAQHPVAFIKCMEVPK